MCGVESSQYPGGKPSTATPSLPVLLEGHVKFDLWRTATLLDEALNINRLQPFIILISVVEIMRSYFFMTSSKKRIRLINHIDVGQELPRLPWLAVEAASPITRVIGITVGIDIL